MTTFEAVPQGTFYTIRRNVARGITPTVSNWDTAPSNLERVTDGRTDLATGEGTKTTSGAQNVATMVIDWGYPVNGFVMAMLDGKVNTGSATLYYQQKQNGNWSWGAIGAGVVKYTNYHYPTTHIDSIWNASAVKLYFYTSGAITLTVKYYEVAVFEVVL